MISCHEVMAQLWAYIDGELTPEWTARIRAHLEMCERCHPQYDYQRTFLAFVHRLAAQPLPPGLRRRVFQALLEEARAQ